MPMFRTETVPARAFPLDRTIGKFPYLQINVIDNGSLLSEENLSHLFERYRRADKEEIQNEFGIDLHYVKN